MGLKDPSNFANDNSLCDDCRCSPLLCSNCCGESTTHWSHLWTRTAMATQKRASSCSYWWPLAVVVAAARYRRRPLPFLCSSLYRTAVSSWVLVVMELASSFSSSSSAAASRVAGRSSRLCAPPRRPRSSCSAYSQRRRTHAAAAAAAPLSRACGAGTAAL